MDDLFHDSLERFLKAHCSSLQIRGYESGTPTFALWELLDELGYCDALIAENLGGAGLGLRDIRRVLLLIGKSLLPLPLGATMIARALLSITGAKPPPGPIVLVSPTKTRGGYVASVVPFGRVADYALMQFEGGWILTSLNAAGVLREPIRGSNSSTIRWPTNPTPLFSLAMSDVSLRATAAALHAALMVGAMGQLLDMTVAYANSREQFGRPIGKFQIIQQQLAVMAEHVLSADIAVQLTFAGAGALPESLLAAVAKMRAGEAATQVAAIAHAVHGAIGLSEEYDLQLYVRRLYEWRVADGSESYWSHLLGDNAMRSEGAILDFVRERLSFDVSESY